MVLMDPGIDASRISNTAAFGALTEPLSRVPHCTQTTNLVCLSVSRHSTTIAGARQGSLWAELQQV